MGRYCSQCGQLLGDSSRFCSRCGTQQADAAAGTSYGPQNAYQGFQAAETVIVAFHARLKTHGPIPYGYIVAVTPARFIFAGFRPDLQRQAAEQAKLEARQQGRGVFGRLSASMGANRNFPERYMSMSPDQILAETPGNFQLPVNQIIQLVYIKARTYSTGDGYSDTDPAQLKIVTPAGDYRLEITQVDPDKEVIPALSAYYGHVLRQS